ncbi:MAG: hypothetical protein EB116_16845, partial [Betaproteobacteria bacterium]|nr:hypothetical protein [Betaproteobacteria bacterium]
IENTGQSGLTVTGSEGSDTLLGSSGLDSLIGGPGADRFVFSVKDLYGAGGSEIRAGIDAIGDLGGGDAVDILDFGVELYRGLSEVRDATKREAWLEFHKDQFYLVIETQSAGAADGSDLRYLLLGPNLPKGLDQPSAFSDGLLSVPSSIVSVNVRGSFLKSAQGQAASQAATQISLDSVGAKPGNYLSLNVMGAFGWGEQLPENGRDALGVFIDANSRVLGVSSVNSPISTNPTTTPNSQDIPQDFAISADRTLMVQVPEGATALRLMTNDWYVDDNYDSNNDFSIRLTVFTKAELGTRILPEGDTALREGVIASARYPIDPDGVLAGSARYSWQVLASDGSWLNIVENARDSRYLVGDQAVGKPLRVKVSYTDNTGRAETVYSAATPPIAGVGNQAPKFAASHGGTVALPAMPMDGLWFETLALANGKTLVAFNRSSGNDVESWLMRLSADGSLDSGFGLNGRVNLTPAFGDIGNQRLLEQSDGKILRTFTGLVDANNPKGAVTGFVERLLPDGNPDLGFGKDGVARLPIMPNDSYQLGGRGLAIQADGKLLMTASVFSPNGERDVGVFRLNQDGTLDT